MTSLLTTASGNGSWPEPGGAPLLQVDDVHTWFETSRGVVKAVDGVSLELDRGRTIGIVGESGSGKTVLSRTIMNLLPRKGVGSSGRVVLDGQDITGWSVRRMRSLWGVEMAMVFQDPMTSLNPVVKIGRQITESLRHHLDMSKSEATTTALALLRSVGLPAPERRLREYPHQLSGGMRQRVTLAIALACGPRLLIADEPTTALDVTVQRQILDLLRRQQQERYMAMVLVTHDLGVVANHTDDIVVMYAGQVVERASTPDLFARMRHPYTEALMGSIPRVENPSHTTLNTIPGRPPDLVAPPAGCRFAPRCSYARDRCWAEEPPLEVDSGTGHAHRCFYPVGGGTSVAVATPTVAPAVASDQTAAATRSAADTQAATATDPTDPTDGEGES